MRGTGLVVIPAAKGKIADAHLYGLLFAGAVAAFCLRELIGARLGVSADVLAIAGGATCGWSWLVIRALFQRPGSPHPRWPLALVLAMIATEGMLRLDGGGSAPVMRIAGNVEGLVSSTLLLLAAIEPLRGIRDVPPPERRFRLSVAGGYAAMLAVAVLWVDGAPAGSAASRLGGAIKAVCAFAALLGMALAIWYRAGNPLPAARCARRLGKASGDTALGERILDLLREEAAFTQPDLRVADLARRLGEAEYKVTQCITGALGFRNFNHMVNHFRIAEAKRRLTDPGLRHLPILTIALDCGFGSIGPFNRAFKTETGSTPTHFRRTRNAVS
jgi:AraC-like DNA-binding protein